MWKSVGFAIVSYILKTVLDKASAYERSTVVQCIQVFFFFRGVVHFLWCLLFLFLFQLSTVLMILSGMVGFSEILYSMQEHYS